MLVYLITNLSNGKRYVGKTCRPLLVRWRQHVYYSQTNSTTPLHRAIAKHGKDSFSIAVLCKPRTNAMANKREREFIRKLNTRDCGVGYNVLVGGDGMYPGFVPTEETRRRMRESHLGKPNAGQFKKGQVAHNKGTKVSRAMRKRIGAAVSLGLIGNKRRSGIPHTEEMREHLRGVLRSICKKGGEAVVAKHPNLGEERRATMKKFWEEMTPEYRAEYLRRRTQARWG